MGGGDSGMKDELVRAVNLADLISVWQTLITLLGWLKFANLGMWQS